MNTLKSLIVTLTLGNSMSAFAHNCRICGQELPPAEARYKYHQCCFNEAKAISESIERLSQKGQLQVLYALANHMSLWGYETRDSQLVFLDTMKTEAGGDLSKGAKNTWEKARSWIIRGFEVNPLKANHIAKLLLEAYNKKTKCKCVTEIVFIKNPTPLDEINDRIQEFAQQCKKTFDGSLRFCMALKSVLKEKCSLQESQMKFAVMTPTKEDNGHKSQEGIFIKKCQQAGQYLCTHPDWHVLFPIGNMDNIVNCIDKFNANNPYATIIVEESDTIPSFKFIMNTIYLNNGTGGEQVH